MRCMFVAQRVELSRSSPTIPGLCLPALSALSVTVLVEEGVKNVCCDGIRTPEISVNWDIGITRLQPLERSGKSVGGIYISFKS